MTPIDYRNATWQDLQAHVVDLRLRVLSALRQHGPCTTRELASLSGIDLLTVRPRVTELKELGFVELVEDKATKTAAALRGYAGQGVYRALSEEEAWQIYKNRVREATREEQPTLGI